jgi:uncharacterized membrane protein YwzB
VDISGSKRFPVLGYFEEGINPSCSIKVDNFSTTFGIMISSIMLRLERRNYLEGQNVFIWNFRITQSYRKSSFIRKCPTFWTPILPAGLIVYVFRNVWDLTAFCWNVCLFYWHLKCKTLQPFFKKYTIIIIIIIIIIITISLTSSTTRVKQLAYAVFRNVGAEFLHNLSSVKNMLNNTGSVGAT